MRTRRSLETYGKAGDEPPAQTNPSDDESGRSGTLVIEGESVRDGAPPATHRGILLDVKRTSIDSSSPDDFRADVDNLGNPPRSLVLEAGNVVSSGTASITAESGDHSLSAIPLRRGPRDMTHSPHPLVRYLTTWRSTALSAVVGVAILLLGACGGGDPGNEVQGNETPGIEAPASESVPDVDAEADDTGPGDETEVPTGEPRGTVVIDGTEHTLALVGTIAPECRISETNSRVSGMGSGTHAGVGISVTYGGAADINWRASVTDYDNGGAKWEVGHKPTSGQDVTHEVSEGRVVIEGVWGQLSGGATETLRLELICPPA